MPSAGQKRLSRWCPRHARSLKNRVCALQESPPRPLRLVPSTPVRTLTSHIAVRLGQRRPIYVPGLARAGQEHRSKRCATWACRRASTEACAPADTRVAPTLVHHCRPFRVGILGLKHAGVARRDLRAPACPTARPARSRCASAALGRPWRCGVVVLTPEGYDNLHTGDSHRSPICHTGDSHRSRFVTPEPSHRRRVDHTGSICSAHTGISTQQNFARPNSGDAR